jgi:hypothetical protein
MLSSIRDGLTNTRPKRPDFSLWKIYHLLITRSNLFLGRFGRHLSSSSGICNLQTDSLPHACGGLLASRLGVVGGRNNM